ncbi:MAG: glycosyltransferase family 87 protein [Candidatus Sulfotelmatobacter sp.]
MLASTPKRFVRLVVLLLCSASMYFYWRSVPQNIDAIAPGQRPRALTDLYPRWYGARELLLHHRDPYNAAVTREIQLAYDGREQRFAYPLYAIFLVAPTIGMQFHSAQVVFLWFLAAVTGLSLALWLSVVRLRLSLPVRITLFATVFLSIPVLQGLSLLQFGLLVAGLLAGATAAIVSGQLFLAGTLLAVATIKPPMCLLALCWLALWASGNWRQRRSLPLGFASMLAILVLASEFLVPGWVLRYPGVLASYAKHTAPITLAEVLLPHWLHWPVAIAALLVVTQFCWKVRRQPASSDSFLLALAFALSLTVLIVPTALPPYNDVLLLPAILLILRRWQDLWSLSPRLRIVISLLIEIVILPWLLAMVVTFASLMPTRPWLLKLALAPLYISLELPFAVLGLLLLLARAFPSVPALAGVLPNSPASHTAGT